MSDLNCTGIIYYRWIRTKTRRKIDLIFIELAVLKHWLFLLSAFHGSVIVFFVLCMIYWTCLIDSKCGKFLFHTKMTPFDRNFSTQVSHCIEHFWNSPICVCRNNPSQNQAVLISWSFSLASILTTHLVLNLKQAGAPHLESQLSTLPEPIFAISSFVGNLGAPIQDSEEDIEDRPDEIGLQEFWGVRVTGAKLHESQRVIGVRIHIWCTQLEVWALKTCHISSVKAILELHYLSFSQENVCHWYSIRVISYVISCLPS